MNQRCASLIAALRRAGLRLAYPYDTDALREAVFNGAATPQALALVTCRDEEDVSVAVRAAADAGVPVAVTAGGHDLWSRGFAADTLVLDIRRMNHVHVDHDAREVTIGGGTLTRNLLTALPPDQVTAVGTSLSVGVTGFALGGGYGALINRCGLGADCIVRGRVVLANGTIALADVDHDNDLLWSLRGGGSGFGVVASLTLGLQTLPVALHAMCVWPLSAAKSAMQRAQDLIDRHPFDLSCFTGFMTLPTSEKAFFATPLWTGDPAAGESLFRELTTHDGAHCVDQRWLPFRDTLTEENEKAWPKDRHYDLRTRTLTRLDDTAIDLLVDGARRMPGGASAIIMHDFHGVASGLPRDTTAFPMRTNHFVVEAIASWDASYKSTLGEAAMRWVDTFDAGLSRIALPGGYTNLLAPLQVDRVRSFYGASASRLLAVKQRVDPDDLFRRGIGRLNGIE
jgi:hypothetical protein